MEGDVMVALLLGEASADSTPVDVAETWNFFLFFFFFFFFGVVSTVQCILLFLGVDVAFGVRGVVVVAERSRAAAASAADINGQRALGVRRVGGGSG